MKCDIYIYIYIYIVPIRFLMLGWKLTLVDVFMLDSKNTHVTNNNFEICFRESAKCKMTAQTGKTYHMCIIFCNLECIVQLKPRLSNSDQLFVFFVSLSRSNISKYPDLHIVEDSNGDLIAYVYHRGVATGSHKTPTDVFFDYFNNR